jgi:glycosyltransferase involved in cell wall biosynthesis
VTDPVPVTFLISHAQRGGSERYLELLLDRLEQGWLRSVISLQAGPFVDRLRSRGLTVEIVETGPRLSMLPAALRVRRLLRRQRPAVIHANGVKAALVATMATRATRMPVVWVKHDFSWDGWLGRRIGRRCDQVVGVSAAVTRTFGDSDRFRVRVIHNGIPPLKVDRETGRRLVRQLLGAEPEAVVVLVGRLHPAKGQTELVEAAPRVLERQPGARFLLLGGEDPYQLAYARRVRERIGQLGLEAAFAIRGHHEDAPAVMSGSDLVAMPSGPDERGMGREGFGLVGIEAMAVGTPVVGYADGALPEVLGDRAELVPAGDREALADSIVALLDDPSRREQLGARGRAMVRERYSIDATAAGMRERYAEAASRRG